MNDLSITDYTIVHGDDLDSFIDEINKAIEDDWQPIGNLAVASIGERVFLYQVIIRIGE